MILTGFLVKINKRDPWLKVSAIFFTFLITCYPILLRTISSDINNSLKKKLIGSYSEIALRGNFYFLRILLGEPDLKKELKKWEIIGA